MLLKYFWVDSGLHFSPDILISVVMNTTENSLATKVTTLNSVPYTNRSSVPQVSQVVPPP